MPGKAGGLRITCDPFFRFWIEGTPSWLTFASSIDRGYEWEDNRTVSDVIYVLHERRHAKAHKGRLQPLVNLF